MYTLQLEKVPEGEMLKLESYPNLQKWIIFLTELWILCRANKERNPHQEKKFFASFCKYKVVKTSQKCE